MISIYLILVAHKIKKQYTKDTKDLEELYKDYKNLSDRKWDLMLIEAAEDDALLLKKENFSSNVLNTELEKAKLEFIDTFKTGLPVRTKVARIINLLQIEEILHERSSSADLRTTDVKKSQKHLN